MLGYIFQLFFFLITHNNAVFLNHKLPFPSIHNSQPKNIPIIKSNFTLIKIALSGGIAGGMTNAILYPIDTLKTMSQSDRTIKSVWGALRKLQQIGIHRAYSGIVPSVLGSIPSSTLYFGSYETAKLFLQPLYATLPRQYVHMLAAASGNFVSSFIYVPKEFIKTRMQSYKTSSESSITFVKLIKSVFEEQGLKGFYPSYRATLAKNIPSAVIRFTVYEELKYITNRNNFTDIKTKNFIVMCSGSIASMISSAFSTPIDVIKTRYSLGSIPAKTPIIVAIKDIVKNEGILGIK